MTGLPLWTCLHGLYLLRFFSLSQSPKGFLESYEDMLLYTQRDETWPITKQELEGRGVSNVVIPLYLFFQHVPLNITTCRCSCQTQSVC